MVVTPDNSTLIVSESFAGRLTAFDIAADGSLSNRRVWADGIGPDGICIDAEGAIWTLVGGHPHPHGPRRRAPRASASGSAKAARSLERIELDRAGFACMLGGPDGGRCSCWRPSGAASSRSTR